MSTLPLPLLLSLAEELDNLQSRFYDNDFGLGIPALKSYNYHPALPLVAATPHNLLQRIHSSDKNKQSLSRIGKDGFQVCMDVQHFKPSELTVKTVNNSIVVEGKHEERQDEHGFVSRHFVRRYELPPGYDANQVASTLSSDGVLTVKVPPPPKSDASNERIIQIQQTGPAHLTIKENPKEEKEDEKN